MIINGYQRLPLVRREHMKTLKQIADELGIEKQKVYRFVQKHHINEADEVKQTKLYDETAESLIKSHFCHITASNERCNNESHPKSSFDPLLAQLMRELDIKNEQIKRLQEENANLIESLKTSQALHAGTIQKQLEDKTVEPPKKWWQRR